MLRWFMPLATTGMILACGGGGWEIAEDGRSALHRSSRRDNYILDIGCVSRGPSVSIFRGVNGNIEGMDVADGSATVMIDGGNITHWDVSGGLMLMISDADDLLEPIGRGSRMSVAWPTKHGREQTEFDLTGAGPVMKRIAAACPK